MQYVYQFIDFLRGKANTHRTPPVEVCIHNMQLEAEGKLAGQDLCQMAQDQISCG